MVNRFLEVMAMALLVVMTIGTTFQVLNFQMLRDIQREIRNDRATPLVVQAPPPQFVQLPAPAAPQPAAPNPQPQPVARQEEPPAQQAPVKPVAAAPPLNTAPPPDEPAAKTPVATEAPKPQPSAAPPPQWQEYSKDVMQVISQLFEAKYDDVYLRFTPTFAAKLSRDDLAGAMDDVRKLHGKLDKLADVSVPQGLQPVDTLTFRVRVHTTSGSLLQFSVTMTPEKKVDGLLFMDVTN